jgi:hypothetical protein
MFLRQHPYDEALADEICMRLSTSNLSLATICGDAGMPSLASVLSWATHNPDFTRKLSLARQFQADYLAEEIIAIIDEPLRSRSALLELRPLDDFDRQVMIEMPALRPSTPSREELAEMKIELDHRVAKIKARQWVAAKLRPAKWGRLPSIDADDREIVIVNDPN